VVANATDATVDVADVVVVADVVAAAILDIHLSHHVRRCFDSLEYSRFNSLLLLLLLLFLLLLMMMLMLFMLLLLLLVLT
jgi:hypothetical protein